MAVVFQPPFHRRGAAHVDAVNARYAAQPGLDLVLGEALDDDGRGGGVQRVAHERAFLLVVRPAHPQERVAHLLRQVRPRLADDGRGLEAGGVDVRVLVQLHVDPSPAVARGRADFLDALDAGEHRLQAGGDFHLDDPRRVARHVVADAQPGQDARGRQLDGQQGHEREARQRRAQEGDDNREG